jgi:hypothetical protein
LRVPVVGIFLSGSAVHTKAIDYQEFSQMETHKFVVIARGFLFRVSLVLAIQEFEQTDFVEIAKIISRYNSTIFGRDLGSLTDLNEDKGA